MSERKTDMFSEGSRTVSFAVLVQAALRHQQAGRFQEAEDLCGLALGAAPDNPDVLGLLGVLNAQQQRFELASRYFAMAIGAAPNRADLLCNYANTLLVQGLPEVALAQCQKARDLDSERVATHTLLSAILLALERPREAIVCYRRALALEPGNPEGWSRLGELLKAQGKIEEAGECFRKALALCPDNAVQAWQLATVAPVWLAPLEGKRIRLRRYAEEDAEFLHRCFRDSFFMEHYNHNIPQGRTVEVLKNKLRKAATLHPCQSRTGDWVIERQGSGEPLGIANLVEIQFAHRRAEFLIGMPDPAQRTAGLALESTLLVLDYAFNRVGLHKLTAIVYANNLYAQKNVESLGFVQESHLREQMLEQASGRFLDLYGYGMTQGDFRGNARLGRLSRRLLGRDVRLGSD
ncbi:MAG: GNAT family N-acetyltransferase [Thermodesulfobacteriota bacterium]